MTHYNFSDRLPAEFSDFTPEEIAQVERIYQEGLRRHEETFAQDHTGQLENIYLRTAAITVRYRRNQKNIGLLLQDSKPTAPIPQAPQQEKPKPEQKPKKSDNNVIQFALALPERTRAVSNATVRAALFAAVQGESRELFNDVTLASQDGVKIIFSGEQLNQDDHDVFMQLVFMAIDKPLGDDITVSASAILAGLGRGRGGKEHDRLKEEIRRLIKGTVDIKCNGLHFIGHLINDALQDETLPTHQRHWTYQLNPKMAVLFGRNQYTLIDWEQRKQLKQKDLARWLHLYFASHANPFPVSVEFLRNISGSKTKELKKFRENLKKALESLKEIGFITSWYIDKDTDLVHVKRVTSLTQSQPPIESSLVLPSQAVVSPNPDRYLKPVTIEKFRALYPNLDPYACKADFQLWLEGKTYPTNYDTAFLGFAKKWTKGKI
jgi:hypothetical protein